MDKPQITMRDLVTKYGGYRPASRATGIPYQTLRENYLKEIATEWNTPKRVFFMTDTHDCPNMDKSHLYHIAKHIKATKPDIIIHGGDMWDAASLCHHVDNKTYKARAKPSLKDDLDSLHEALQILTEESGRQDFHMTLGNHENWLWQFQDRNPELFGFAQDAFETIFKSVGWTLHPYGRYVDFGGVNFTHCPMNLMGKHRGGENTAKLAATRAVKDVVFGHTHRYCHHQEAKDGNDIWVIALNAGCTMPDGYRPDYAIGPIGWFYGVVEFTIDNEHITDVSQISLKTLKERYA
jgi:predicted MPP superfamily phosphohydrolase